MSKTGMKNKIMPPSSSGLSLSNFKSSINYLWNTNAVLGKGATGAVYFGHNKHSGETVAVKCFNHLSHMRPYEVQKREFEVLKKVNHENIVKLLAIEEENDTKQKVLVMELCTGGSLFNILDDPLNSNGLEEKEFLLVLKHLAAGMKHLRDMNIIHRDLKPGNIMKFVAEDGISIYKLTDFGAARELDDDQQFMSLYGTEEYLHPDMYERAVLRKPVGKSFKANVDLWSIGVTLYHIATGSLPFRPYGGRKNKETMYKITTEKASGIISGTQTSENGEIKWSRNLPESCLLSQSLQPLVTELLAGLLECDAHRMWSFEKFFSSVTNILEHKVIFVYYVGTLSLHSIYCHTTEKVVDLKSRFDSLYKVPPKDQILVWANDELNHIITKNPNSNKATLLKDFPNTGNSKLSNLLTNKRSSNISTVITILANDFPVSEISTTEHTPLFLLNGQMNSKIRCSSGPVGASKFPDLINSPLMTDVDAQYAKHCSSLAYTTLRQIDKFIHNYKLACQIPCHMLKLIDISMKLLDEKYSCFNYYLNILKERLDNLIQINDYLSQLIKLMVDSIIKSNSIHLFNFSSTEQIKNQFDNINADFKSLSSSSIMDEKLEQLKDLWPSSKELESIKHLVSVQSKAKIYTAKIRESWLMLHKDKQIKSLNHHEEELHQLEKLKLDSYCKKLNELVSKEINPCGSIADKLEEWYQGAQVSYVKPQLIISELYEFCPAITEIENNLKSAYEEHNKIWSNLFKEVKNFETEWSQAVGSLESNVAARHTPNDLAPNHVVGGNATFFNEVKSLNEHCQLLKDAFKDFEMIFSEVQSFNK